MYRSFILALLLFFFWHLTFAGEPPIHYATRGEVLYLTQCINCHSA